MGKNSNKGELSFLEDKGIYFRLEYTPQSNDDFNNLGVLTDTNLIETIHSNSISYEIEHSPSSTSPDSYYINHDEKVIVGYEHFYISSSKEDKKGSHGMKVNRTFEGSIKRELVEAIKSKRDTPLFNYKSEQISFKDVGCIYCLMYIGEHVCSNHEIRTVNSTIPYIIRENIKLLMNRDTYDSNESVVSSKIFEVSVLNIISSVKKEIKSHIDNYDSYIDNLFIEMGGNSDDYKVELNFVFDMRDNIIPSEVINKTCHKYRVNYLDVGGLSEILEGAYSEISNIINKGVGAIFILPVANEEVIKDNYGMWTIYGYSIYYIKDIETLNKYINGEFEDKTANRYSRNSNGVEVSRHESQSTYQSFTTLANNSGEVISMAEIMQHSDGKMFELADIYLMNYTKKRKE